MNMNTIEINGEEYPVKHKTRYHLLIRYPNKIGERWIVREDIEIIDEGIKVRGLRKTGHKKWWVFTKEEEGMLCSMTKMEHSLVVATLIPDYVSQSYEDREVLASALDDHHKRILINEIKNLREA